MMSRKKAKSSRGDAESGNGRDDKKNAASLQAQLPGKPPFIGFGDVPSPRIADSDQGVESAPSKKNSRTLEAPKGSIQIENYFTSQKLEKLSVDEGIRMFSRHNPERQKNALVNVAGLEGGNVTAAIMGSLLIAYIGIHHPSEKERWGKPPRHWLYELGAIEVSRNYRELGLAKAMLDVAFDDPFYDDKIILTTAFTWHWDLEGTGMSKGEYREMFLHLASKYGFVEMGTDDPNVTMDHANIFLVRLGRKASFSRYREFSSMLYVNAWEAMLHGF
jgi:acetoin utilization protein AcuA